MSSELKCVCRIRNVTPHDTLNDYESAGVSSRLTFRAWSEDCSLDGIGLETPLKSVIPQSNDTILSTSNKTLNRKMLALYQIFSFQTYSLRPSSYN